MVKPNKEKMKDLRARITNALKFGIVDPVTVARYTVDELQDKVRNYEGRATMYNGLARSIYKKHRDSGKSGAEIRKFKDYYQAQNNSDFNKDMARYWRVILERKKI
jgi:hypothetical protein